MEDNIKALFFDEANLFITVWDKDIRCVDISRAALKALHFKKEDLLGKHMAEISPDVESTGRLSVCKEVFRTGNAVTVDEMRTHPSLGNFHVRIKMFKAKEYLCIISENITDLKETIDELETFIYKSHHDIRGPIASILGLTEVANTQAKDLTEAKKICEMIRKQAERLDDNVGSLMETMRIRKGEKIIHLIDFNELVDEVLNSLAFVNGYKELKFIKNISIRQKFYSDKLLIISVFQNLIDNAIKYRRNITDSFIEIFVADEGHGVKIKISDNGIGIPDDLQKEVYKMFFRATNQASGSGLGLYTVYHTIKKLSGNITLDSKVNVGSTFTVYLPNENPSEQTL